MVGEHEYSLSVIIAIILSLLVATVLGGAIFLYEGGIFVCEDTAMMKVALGSFFGLYILTAIGLKIFLPTVPAGQVDVYSVTGFWTDAYAGLEAGIRLPEPLARLFTRSGRL